MIMIIDIHSISWPSNQNQIMKQVETHEWNLIKDVRLTTTDPACPLNAQIPAQG
jgi:metal-sulfur cluster biosynthetic enzyme